MACRPASTSSTTESTPPSSTPEATSDLLAVGRVTKAHGLRGEVVVKLWTDRTERLDPGSVLTALTTPRRDLTVARARTFGDRWIVEFEGVVERSEAELLRGTELGAPALDVPGALWVHELVGASVVDAAGVALGVVAAVEANPASDLLVLEGGGLIPLRFVVERDVGAGTLVVDLPSGLLDLP
ncbi:MAG: ribosome maturation factor RimM [Acidimicrobiales bacterium]